MLQTTGLKLAQGGLSVRADCPWRARRPVTMEVPVRTWIVVAWLMGCGGASDPADTDASDSDTPAGGGACGDLCASSGFNGGTELDYGSVVECQCEGGGGTIAQADCTAYCADLGVSAPNALLSGTDKCVCDGTAE